VPAPAEKDPIQSIADILKVTTSAAGAALLFGINLGATSPLLYSRGSQYGFVASWLILGASAAFGLWTLLYVPALLAGTSNMTVDSPDVRIPYQLHLVLLAIGVIVLASLIIVSTVTGAAVEDRSIRSPLDAADAALHWLPSRDRVARISVIELVKGTDENRFAYDTWHVQVELRATPAPPARSMPAGRQNRSARVSKTTASRSYDQAPVHTPAPEIRDIFLDPTKGGRHLVAQAVH
jgi:hypothetical protein